MHKQPELIIKSTQMRRIFLWVIFTVLLIIFVYTGFCFTLGLWLPIKILNYREGDTIAAFIFLLVLWVADCFILVLLVYGLRHALLLQKIGIDYWGDYFSFQYKQNNQVIHCSQILYAWADPTKTTIVLKKGDRLWSYSFLRIIYGKRMVKEIEFVLKEKGILLDDSKHVRQVVKKYRLNNLFDKNRFEFVMWGRN